MFKFLFLLFGALILNVADGKLASVSTEDLSNFDDGKEVEDPYLSEAPYENDIALQKRSSSDKLMRRSSLDKNFMRFGRSGCCKEKDSAWFPDVFEDPNGEQTPQTFEKRNSIPLVRRVEDNFIRFGRSKSDNFIRFGRDDNFMRFGRGDKDNFMRFGRGDKDNFMRFGRGDKDNFMRFGRGDKDNFMRFGRKFGEDSDEMSKENFYRSIKSDNFMRFGKDSKNDSNFLRFGKSDGKGNGFIRFGRNGTNFLRFGRGSSEDADKVDESVDTEVDASENGAVTRRKRMVSGELDRAGNNKVVIDLPEKLSI